MWRLPMTYGTALRQRALDLYDEGHSTAVIAERWRACESWCRRVRQVRHEPPHKIDGGHFKIDSAGREHLVEHTARQPDTTLIETVRQHSRILQAILTGGLSEAQTAMVEHLLRQHPVLKQVMDFNQRE